MIVDSKPDQQLLKRVQEAEARECQLKQDHDDLRNKHQEQSLRVKELQATLDAVTTSLNQVKRQSSSRHTYVHLGLIILISTTLRNGKPQFSSERAYRR